MAFEQAVKEAFSLKLVIAGIAGVGKSYTSLQIARLLAGKERFAVIDAENRKARKYADLFQFDVSDLDVFSLAAYEKEIKLAESSGYKVLVIDGLSQLWEGKGGIKQMVEMIAKRDHISTIAAWQPGNNLLYDFIKVIMDSPMHIICTMKAKTGLEATENDKGKTQYKRSNLAPIQKDGLEFEFDLFAMMDTDHDLIFQKSLCPKLDRKVIQVSKEGETQKLVALLLKWMEGEERLPSTGTSQPQPVAIEKQPATEQQMQSLKKLFESLGKETKELASHSLTHSQAKSLIEKYAQMYREKRANTENAGLETGGTADMPSIDEMSSELSRQVLQSAS